MIGVVRTAAAACLLAGVAGCGPDYSPNTYSTAAVQQANKVEKGVVIGVRQVDVTSAGVVGAATGAAAGGALGSQAPGGGVTGVFGAIGGGLVGGLVGTAAEHTTADTSAYEYIVRKPNGDLVSVTQKDPVALALGQHVLVISGNQARVVPDYTQNPEPAAEAPHLPTPNMAIAPPGAAVIGPGAPTPLTPPTGVEPPPAPVTAQPLAEPAPPASTP